MIIWTVIINADDPYETKTFKDIPVHIINEDALRNENKLYEIDNGMTVSVTVKAPRSVLGSMETDDIYATADFKQLSIVNAVPIEVEIKENTAFNSELVEVISNEPKVMTLTLEEIAEASFRVEAVAVGEVADGYYLADVTVNPNIIKVTGSTRKIAGISSIIAEIDVSNADEGFSTTANIVAYDNEGNIMDSQKIAFEVNEVSVTAVVYPTKEVAINVVMSGIPADGYRCTDITFIPNSVVVTGSEEELKYVEAGIIIPFDITDLDSTAIEDINVNEWLEYLYPDYSLRVVGDKSTIAVTAKIEQLGYKEFAIQPSDIEFIGLEKGLSASFKVSGSIKVRIVATSDIVKSISRNEIKFYVNASELTEGLHYVNILAESEEDISVVQSPVAVEVIAAGETDNFNNNNE